AAGGSLLFYTNGLSAPDYMASTNQGFRFSVQARFVNDFNDTKTMTMSYGLGNRRFLVWWYLDANNDLIAEMESGDVFTVTTNGMGTNFFHTHEITFNPGNQTISYFVDGIIRGSNLPPVASTWKAGM